LALPDTFRNLQSLPEQEQIDLCTAALHEADTAILAVAVPALADPNQLNRPDIIVSNFGSLSANAIEASRAWCEELLTVACTCIAVGADPERLSAYHAVTELAGPEGIDVLMLGIDDEIPEVCDVAFAGIELRVRAYAEALRESKAGGGPELPKDGREAAFWPALEQCVRAFLTHDRASVLDLLPEFGARSLPLIVNVLQDRNGDVLGNALVKALIRSRAAECAELVLSLAAHEVPIVRLTGKRVLRERQDEDFKVGVAGFLVEQVEERMDALEGEWPGEALFESIPQLTEEVAARLLPQALSSATDKSEGQTRAESFLAHPAIDVQLAAIEAMRVLGCPNGFDAIGRILASAPDPVRRSAAHLVAELRPQNRAALLTPLLGMHDAEARAIALREVSEVGLSHFMERFDAMNPEARAVAARALSKIDPKLVDRVSEELGSLDAKRRIKALRIVDVLDAGADLREPLCDLLADDDVRVRATAVRIIKVTGSVEGMRALVGALADPDRRVRANAIETFEQLDDPTNLDLLMPFLRDRHNRVRANAAKALWNLGWPDARDTLVAMVSDNDPLMRLSAVWAIGEVQFHGARELLRARSLIERDAAVSERIRIALAALGEAPEEPR